MTHSVCLITTKRDRSFPFEVQRSFFGFYPLQSRAVFTAGDIFRAGRRFNNKRKNSDKKLSKRRAGGAEICEEENG